MSSIPAGRGSTRRWAMVLFLAAVAFRGGLAGWTSLGPGEVRGDAVFFYESAISLAEGGGMESSDGQALRMPLYPLFLSLVFRVTGPSVAAAQAAQIILGSVSCVLIFLGARAWLTPGAALFAGWSAVFYFGLAQPCGRLLSECLFAFCLSALLTSWFWWRGRARDNAALGASAALLYLTRPEGILAGLSLMAAGFWAKKGWTWRHSAWIFLSLALAFTAWGLRNRAALGEFRAATTGGGFSLWAALPRTMHDKLGASIGARPPAPEASNELERDRYYQDYARAQLREAPPGLLLRAAAFNLVSAFYPFLPEYEFSYGLLVPLWLYGIWALRGRRELWPVFFLLAAWSAIYVVYGGADSRFRQLYAPLLIWLAAGGAEALYARLGKKTSVAWAAAWGGLNLIVFAFWPQARSLTLLLKKLVAQG